MGFDLNQALAVWLTNTLTGYSLAVWGAVSSMAGGPSAPVWRWVLVEQGLFVLAMVCSVWWVRMMLGVGGTRRTPQHWGAAAVFASVFSLLWIWYHLTAAHAISLGLHPTHGWEWGFFTWGLPTLLVGVLLPGAAFLTQLGIAVGLGAFGILLVGGLWASFPGPKGRRNARPEPASFPAR